MPKQRPGPVPKSVIDADPGGIGNFEGGPMPDTGGATDQIGFDNITLGGETSGGGCDVVLAADLNGKILRLSSTTGNNGFR